MGSLLSKPLTSKNVESLRTPKLHCGSAEMHGCRMSMEDAHILTPIPHFQDALLVGIFDGHNGAECSAYVAETLKETIMEEASLPIAEDRMLEIAMDADKAFFKAGGEAGSTGVWALLYHEAAQTEVDGSSEEHVQAGQTYRVQVANVGDSRAVLWRKQDRSCVSITVDHKPNTPSERERIEASGGHVSVGRVNGDLAVSRAFGDYQFKNNRELPMEAQAVIAAPEVFDHPFDDGDILILACDGVFESNFSNEEVAAFVAENLEVSENPSWTACRVVDEALHRGSKDNISCTIIWNKPMEETRESSESEAKATKFSIPGSFLPLVGNGNPGYRDGFEKMCIRGAVSPAKMISRRYEMLRAAVGRSEPDPSWDPTWEVIKDTCSPEAGFEELDALEDTVEELEEQEKETYFTAFWEKRGML